MPLVDEYGQCGGKSFFFTKLFLDFRILDLNINHLQETAIWA